MSYKFSLKLFLAAFFIGLSVTGASAASIIVNITGDPNGVGNCATGGTCSLRQAIASAAADDGVFFDIPAANCPNGVCTINLTSGLTINKNLNVVGTGARSLIINGNGSSGAQNASVITIVNPSPLSGANVGVTISGLTVTGGNSGQATSPKAGGITADVATTVVLNFVTVTNNQGTAAGGIYCNKAVVLPTSTAFSCSLTLTNSLVSDNTGGSAGGIENHGTMQVVNSTISGNLTTNNGFSVGGISDDANATNNFQGILSVINATITNNVTNNNGVGGITGNFDSQYLPRIRNTIIANNRSGNQVKDISANFTSRGNNLIGSTFGGGGANGNGGFGNSNSNDFINQPANILPLANNGGQSDTHALLAGSPAINAGNNCVSTAACPEDNPPMNLAFDQRGQPFARTFGVAVDIGAFEIQQVLRGTAFDFDGDGKADVSVTRNNSSNLAWYLLNSASGFSATNFGLATDKIVPADYDGDGRTDLAVVRANPDNSLTWYISASRFGYFSFNFGLAGDTPVPADYDGDGRADIAVTRAANGSLFWYLNRTTAGFTGVQFGAAGDVPVIGDFDGDGKTDLAVVRQSGGNLTWYLNRSTAGFAGAQFGLTGDKLVAADYDGDGKTDLAITRTSGGNLTWYVQQSRDGFTGVGFGSTGDIPVPADYDGDGKADVAVARAGGGNLTWYLNRSQSGFTGIQFGNASDRAVENAYIP